MVRRVGRVEWRNVIGRKVVGGESEGRRRREAKMARGEVVVGVRISLARLVDINHCKGQGVTYRVRTRSRGERRTPAMPAAATATPRDARGDGLSLMSSPPMALATSSLGPPIRALGSGRLSRAQSRLLVQLSIAFTSTL